MIKQLVIVIVLICCQSVQGQITFSMHYGDFSGQGYSVYQTNDDGFVVAGEKFNAAQDKDMFLLKTNAYGDTLWLKHFGTDSIEYASDHVMTSDGDHVLFGGTESLPPFSEDLFLVKADQNGNEIWRHSYGGNANEEGHSVIENSSGELVMSGWTSSYGNGIKDVYIIKVNSEGDTLWTRTIGGSENEEGFSVLEHSSGGYFVTGYTQSFGAGERDFYTLRINDLGDTLWTRTYGGPEEDIANVSIETFDGDIVMAGSTSSYGLGPVNIFLVKINMEGDTLWTRVHGQFDRYSNAYDIIETTDGGYMVSGRIHPPGTGGSADVYIMKLDEQGYIEWDQEFIIEPSNMAATSSVGFSVFQTSDQGFVIAGRYFSGSTYELLLIKTDANGVVGIEEFNDSVDFDLYPNPTVGQGQVVTLSIKNEGHSNFELIISDVNGRTYRPNSQIKGNNIEFDTQALEHGLYLVQLFDNRQLILSSKLIVE